MWLLVPDDPGTKLGLNLQVRCLVPRCHLEVGWLVRAAFQKKTPVCCESEDPPLPAAGSSSPGVLSKWTRLLLTPVSLGYALVWELRTQVPAGARQCPAGWLGTTETGRI